MTPLQVDTVVRQIIRSAVVVNIPCPPEIPPQRRLTAPLSVCKDERLESAVLGGRRPADSPGPLPITLSAGALKLSFSRVLT